MDDRRQQEFEQLNAFIDGELGVEDRAAVTARVARDPAYARELAALNQLKVAMVESVPTPYISVPREPVRRRRFAAMAIAASLLLAVAAGITWTVKDGSQPQMDGFVLDRAVALHRSWLPQKPGQTVESAAHQVSAMLHPYVPALSANGLNLAYAGAGKAAGAKDTLLVGYIGSRGCRLTLLVNGVDGERTEPPRNIETENVLAAIWQAGELRYTLLAEGMAKPRFRLISETVRRSSLERLPFDNEARTALAQSRASNPPCRV